MAVHDYDWSSFRSLVREYEALLASPDSMAFDAFHARAQLLLAYLYREGLVQRASGDVYSETGGDSAWADREPDLAADAVDEWFAAWRANEKALVDYLGSYDPFHHVPDVTSPESAVASLGAQMVDVLYDLMAGALLHDDDRLDEAMWEWTFRFDHWGDHALEAMKPLHQRLDWSE